MTIFRIGRVSNKEWDWQSEAELDGESYRVPLLENMPEGTFVAQDLDESEELYWNLGMYIELDFQGLLKLASEETIVFDGGWITLYDDYME